MVEKSCPDVVSFNEVSIPRELVLQQEGVLMLRSGGPHKSAHIHSVRRHRFPLIDVTVTNVPIWERVVVQCSSNEACSGITALYFRERTKDSCDHFCDVHIFAGSLSLSPSAA
jgi:hypothetical protein